MRICSSLMEKQSLMKAKSSPIALFILMNVTLLSAFSGQILDAAYGQEAASGSSAVAPAPGAETKQLAEGGKAAARELSVAFEEAARSITPSVVNISSIKKPKSGLRGPKQLNDPFFEQFKDFFGEDFMDRFQQFGPDGRGGPNGRGDMPGQQGLGTGVIVDARGYILTNNHVVEGADELRVRLNEDQTVKAELIGTDPRSDIAVIKIKGNGLKAARLGSSEELKIGEWVVAAGNPFGLDNSITAGIVSAKGRSFQGGGQYEDFIQTDAAINPGNSGGPLVNLDGEVVGINTAIFSRSGGYMGIGFAIPIDMAKLIMESLITKGKVVRGWLGVGIQNLTEDLSASFNYSAKGGALIGHVEEAGPAAKAGLKQGDIITKIKGEDIKNVTQLRNMIASFSPGSSVEVTYYREGKTQTATVKIGELPTQKVKEEVEIESKTDIGVAIDELTPEMARRLGLNNSKGVIVKSVKPGSIGARAGVQPKDVIVSLNGKKIASVEEFYKELDAGDLRKGIRAIVKTEGMERFVFFRADEESESEVE